MERFPFSPDAEAVPDARRAAPLDAGQTGHFDELRGRYLSAGQDAASGGPLSAHWARFSRTGHSPCKVLVQAAKGSAEFPWTLDLRQFPSSAAAR